MRWTLLASTGLAVIMIAAGPAIAKSKSGSHPQHATGDNTGNGNSDAATTPQGDGDDAAGSAATVITQSGSSWTGNIIARTHVQIDANGHTFGEDIDSDAERRQTDAKISDHAKARAGKRDGDPTAQANALARSLAKTHKPNGKDATIFRDVKASASAVGGKDPKASASAQSGKEKVHVTAAAGGTVTGSGGKTIVLHPKPGETVVVEYTRHTEGVGISLPHRAEAYAAAAQGGHVYVGKTLIDAARAAAYAFAEGWQNGAYAYAKAESTATATSTDGFDHSHAQAFTEAEAAIWQGGVFSVKLPKLPNLAKLHVPPPTPAKVQPDGVNLLLQRDPVLPRAFCMAKRLPQGWGLACTTVDKMPSQAEIDARLRAGWTEIATSP
jgi:hypothetical protein